MIGIYKITNPIGQIYVGGSTDIKNRLKYYKSVSCKGQTKLYASILKFGLDNHIIEILEECEKENLNNREYYFGSFFNVLGVNGLNNILPKGDNGEIGICDETREKMRIDKIGKPGTPHTEESKAKIRFAQLGKKHTLEHRRKVSENHARINAKLVIDIETDIYYHSIKEAAFAKGMIHSSLKNRVNGNSPTYTSIRVA